MIISVLVRIAKPIVWHFHSRTRVRSDHLTHGLSPPKLNCHTLNETTAKKLPNTRCTL